MFVLVENQIQKKKKKVGWCGKGYWNNEIALPCFVPFLLFLFISSSPVFLCSPVPVAMAAFKPCSLVVGASFFGTVENDALKAVWYAYCTHNNTMDRADHGTVTHKDKGRIRMKCVGVSMTGLPCRSHCNAVLDKNDPNAAVIRQLDLNHTCTSSSGRKRKLNGDAVQAIAGDVLSVYIPSGAQRGGDPKQLMTTVERSTGYQLGYQSAQRSIKTSKSDSVSVAINQFKLIESYFEVLKNLDPPGSYEIVVDSAGDERTFVSLYVAPGLTKHMWQHLRRCVSVDGTHVSTILGGVLLLLCGKDANNQNVLLAFAYVLKENGPGYAFFFRRVARDFPGRVVVICDGDKGCASQMQSEWKDAALSRCFRHKVENYHTSHPGDQIKREAILSLLYGLGRATTEELWEYLLEKLKKVDGEKTERIANWMETIKEEVNAMYFIKLGLSRFRDLLNNPCEQYNSTILEIRALPVVAMVRGLLQDIYSKGFKRRELGNKWCSAKMVYTEWAEEKFKKDLVSSRDFTVRICEASENAFQADVTLNGESLVTYKCELRQGDNGDAMMVCSCKQMWDIGRPCKHVVAAFRRAGDTAASPHWNLRDEKWIGHKAVYNVSHYVLQYSFPIPSIAAGEVMEQRDLIPWEVPVKAGRPKKRRMKVGDGCKKRECSACGQLGHYASTCSKAVTKRLLDQENCSRRPMKLGRTIIDLTEE